MFQKDFQNAEFIFGKIYIMSVPGQYAAGRIQDGTFMFQNIPRSPKRISTAQDCLNFGCQHIQIKRFRDKIISGY